jgi:hypothetical protein
VRPKKNARQRFWRTANTGFPVVWKLFLLSFRTVPMEKYDVVFIWHKNHLKNYRCLRIIIAWFIYLNSSAGPIILNALWRTGRGGPSNVRTLYKIL